ncbi:GNAT family N-acetyltransferase [Kordiimonas sp. SCSIO 12610]|uniref:GNAT family N-acetyltransferase n=1 Tax=Kordiimonas sp. SCSIO 12610 TaxID=2829597 RepID=UPI00210CB601|nr:GNAT family N-acetyltransferase [Kordiimonas sp. SCSIO 12610]UTW56081.1 GNAT family N-acetyltransferase [Kordiimonas sp. SCSIO 12610]
MSIIIRKIEDHDYENWAELWTGYLAYYKSTLPDTIYKTTFKRLLNDEYYDPRGFLAVEDGKPIGLVHYMLHRHCWREEHVVYLQDLFTNDNARGKGVGKALIEAVYSEADRLGTPTVYWNTEDFNHRAHRLYDYVAKRTPFIKYQR